MCFHYPQLPFCYCSVAHSYLTLCNPVGCSTPGFPVLHYLPELAQTHVYWVGDAIQPSHLLLLLYPNFNFHSTHIYLCLSRHGVRYEQNCRTHKISVMSSASWFKMLFWTYLRTLWTLAPGFPQHSQYESSSLALSLKLSIRSRSPSF